MANVGPNQGRRLRLALSRFAAMLIEEAQSISGLSYTQLDEQLGLPDGQAFRYSRYPVDEKTRAPQAGSIQQLENRVAVFLKRPAHKVVVENSRLISEENWLDPSGVVAGVPDHAELEDARDIDLQLGYEHDWPTFRRLKTDNVLDYESIDSLIKRGATRREWPESLMLYVWQWGMLWERGIPWLTRENYDIEPGISIGDWTAATVEKGKRQRADMMRNLNLVNGS